MYKTPEQENLLSIIESNPFITTKELSLILKVHQNSIRKRLDILIKRELINGNKIGLSQEYISILRFVEDKPIFSIKELANKMSFTREKTIRMLKRLEKKNLLILKQENKKHNNGKTVSELENSFTLITDSLSTMTSRYIPLKYELINTQSENSNRFSQKYYILMKLLKTDPDTTYKAIEEQMGCTKQNIERMVARLEKQKILVRARTIIILDNKIFE